VNLWASFIPPKTSRRNNKPPQGAQIIGLIKNRPSGIVFSRHAYADVLRTIYPDLKDVETQAAVRNPCAVNVWAARPMSRLFFSDINRPMPGLNIWCLVLESTNLPPGSLEAAENAAQIWVPSRFVRDVCVEGGMPAEKLRFVPYFLPRPDTLPEPPPPGAPFKVLVSWDGKSSMNRKNVVNSIRAFKLAFGNDRNVRLKLKTRNLSEERRAEVFAEIADDSRIEYTDESLPGINEVFAGVHCLLHITRAEGYGRHVLEAMQRRVPVVVTAYSGPLDWVTPTNAYLVPFRLCETLQQEFQYPQGGMWAEPDIASAADAMRRARDEYGTSSQAAMLDRAEISANSHASLGYSRAAMFDALSNHF
jgi:glycosyltransferase involved in cell wall biosynthesis